MKLVRTKSELRAALREPRVTGQTIGLVPTMGYLHDGHLSLLRAARERCDVVVVSVFVNPTQFRAGEDLDAYPRDEQRDIAAAEAAGVDLLFVPERREIYPDGHATSVLVEGLSEVLCGAPASRGLEHFRGVTTVVAKLFNITQPDLAFLGQKDAQQALVLGRMVSDLDFPLELVVLPTVREPDGLAMSSRNACLSVEDRARAAAIYAALETVRERAAQGRLAAALERGRAVLAAAGIEAEYLEARDAADLSPVESLDGRPVVVAIAAPIGDPRLIDNIVIDPGTDATSAEAE
jgi:pantoate--beta-alanine ligase